MVLVVVALVLVVLVCVVLVAVAFVLVVWHLDPPSLSGDPLCVLIAYDFLIYQGLSQVNPPK